MALVLKPTLTIEITFRDNDGARASTEVTLPGATTPANAVSFATALIALIAPLSDAVVTGYNIIIGYTENAIPTIPSSDVENKGVFLFNAANGIKSSISIPSIVESVLQANNRDIDQSALDVADFVLAMTGGLSGVSPANAGGSDLVSVRDAYKQNRRSHVSGRTRRG